MDNQAKLEQQILSFEKTESQIEALKEDLKTIQHNINAIAECPFQEGEVVTFVKYPEWLVFLDTLHTQKYHALAKEKGILYMYYNHPELEGVKVTIDHASILGFNSGRNSLRWEIHAKTSFQGFAGIFDQPINPHIKLKPKLSLEILIALIMRAYLEGEKGLDYYLTLVNDRYFEVIRANLDAVELKPEWGTLFKIELDLPENFDGNLHRQLFKQHFKAYDFLKNEITVKGLIKYYQMAP